MDTVRKLFSKEVFSRGRMSLRHSVYSGMIGGTVAFAGIILLQVAGLPFWGFLIFVGASVALIYPLLRKWDGAGGGLGRTQV